MLELCYFGFDGLEGAAEPDRPAEHRVRAASLREGVPFFLDAEGRPASVPNSWLRSLPYGWPTSATSQRRPCLSPKTWRTYAKAYLAFDRWCHANGLTPLECGDHDLRNYRVARLDDKLRPLAATSWNVHLAGLDSFFRWASDCGLIERSPFSYREVQVRTWSGARQRVESNMLRERPGRAHATLKWLQPDAFRLFVDVGLSGLNEEGEPDPSFRSGQSVRARAYAEFLNGTGLRGAEATALLVYELPLLPERRVSRVPLDVPDKISKGGRCQ